MSSGALLSTLRLEFTEGRIHRGQGLFDDLLIINSVARVTSEITDSTSQPCSTPLTDVIWLLLGDQFGGDSMTVAGGRRQEAATEFLGIPDNLCSRTVCIIQHKTSQPGI